MTENRRWLEVFEERAHKALVMAERGWRDFATQMREIKQTESYKEAGYRHFLPYYRDRWQERAGRSAKTVEAYIASLSSLEEMEAVLEPDQDRVQRMPGQTEARILRAGVPDPTERVEAWEHHLNTGRPTTGDRSELRQSIKEYKGEPTVRDTLPTQEMEEVVPKALPEERQFFHRVYSIKGAVDRLDPAAVAAANADQDEMRDQVEAVETIIAWLESYRNELKSVAAPGLRAVK